MFFGYSNNVLHLGGGIWLKKVADCIDNNQQLIVKKVGITSIERNLFFPFFRLKAVLKGLMTKPDIAVLDAYGESCLWMWIILYLFRPSTKLVTIFHHYEPRVIRFSSPNVLSNIYSRCIDSLTKKMLKNSNIIFTVSNSSSVELGHLLDYQDDKKIIITGCSFEEELPAIKQVQKDIDYLCVGRLEKFNGIEDIWKAIIEKNQKAKFVMIGRASLKQRRHLRNIGIDHRGVVSDKIKRQLYSRSKVFLFPSVFEGYGIAITEALSRGLQVVAWKLPVFEERFNVHSLSNLVLVDRNNHRMFALAALEAIKSYYDSPRPSRNLLQEYNPLSWDEVSAKVLSSINSLL